MHDRPFRPCGPGKKGKLLGPQPKHMPCPPIVKQRVKKAEGEEEDIPSFKPVTKFFTRPTPSVVTNFRNLKASFPSHFGKK